MTHDGGQAEGGWDVVCANDPHPAAPDDARSIITDDWYGDRAGWNARAATRCTVGTVGVGCPDASKSAALSTAGPRARTTKTGGVSVVVWLAGKPDDGGRAFLGNGMPSMAGNRRAFKDNSGCHGTGGD